MINNFTYWLNGITGNLIGTLYTGGYLGLKDSVLLSLPFITIGMGVYLLT